jgi:predicted short-subunit dehydrogenase-like oxidoreductase (DUF2520 family)
MPDDSFGERLVLVGPGRAGRALLHSWTSSGGDAVVIARNALAANRRDVPDSVEVRSPDDRRELAGDFLVLAVPDDAIESVASALAPRAACRYSFHLSGALPANALGPLSPSSSLGSLHPLRAFTGSTEESWQDSFVAVEGEEEASEAGSRLCRRIGARPRRVAASEKPLYHCAATLAAGGVASLLSLAARIWEEAGLEPEEGRIELARLAVSASEAVGRLPFEEALTGPVARRDVETVRLHRDVLVRRSDLAGLYRLLALETLRRTTGRGREDEIARLLEIEKSVPEASAELSDKKLDIPTPKG